MPGSWEIRNPDVLVAILTREMVTTKWALNFRKLMLPDSSDVIQISGMPFDHARNHACLHALQLNYKWLLFIDDDVLIPKDTYRRLVAHNKPVISGIYYRRVPPLAPVMLTDSDFGPRYIEKYPSNSLIKADLVGAGCLLISNEILRRLGKNWFEWRVDRDDLGPNDRTSEDYSFCRRVRRELKTDIYVDTSIICDHVGFSASREGALAPLL
jgi:glycosyltransferase involved in cell wall biosynthesis